MYQVSQPWHLQYQEAHPRQISQFESGSIEFQQGINGKPDEIGFSTIHIIYKNDQRQSMVIPNQVWNRLKGNQTDQERIIEFINLYMNESDEDTEWYAYRTGVDCIKNYIKALTAQVQDKIVLGTTIADKSKAVYAEHIQITQARQKAVLEATYSFQEVMRQAIQLQKRLDKQEQEQWNKYLAENQVRNLSDKQIENLQKSKILNNRCLLNLQSIISSVDGYLEEIYIIFKSATGFGFQQIWKTNEAMIIKSLKNIKSLSKKINEDLKDLKDLDLKPDEMKGTYGIILAGAQALISCQILLNSKFRLLYVSDNLPASDQRIFTEYRILQKDAFSPCWQLFLVSRIYDRKSWDADKKYELQRLALTQLDSQGLKKFSHIFEQIQKVKQQIQKTNETIKQKEGSFRTYLWASLTGKSASFFQNLGNFVGKSAKAIAQFLGFKKKSNQQQLIQIKQQKQYTQSQIAEKAKKIQQFQNQNNQLTNQILANISDMNTQSLVSKAVLIQTSEAEAIGIAQKNFQQEEKPQNLIQAGKALIAASNSNRQQQVAKTMMTDKLISKQLDAIDEKRMFQKQKVERSQMMEQEQLQRPAEHQSRQNTPNLQQQKEKIRQQQQQQLKQQQQRQPHQIKRKRRLFTVTKIKSQMEHVSAVYKKLMNHKAKFDRKIKLIVDKTSTQKLDNIIKGQIELKQQMEEFRTKALSMLEQKNSDIEALKQRQQNFYRRIQMLEQKRLLTQTVNSQLNSQIIDNLQANVSSSQFFQSISNKIQQNLSKATVSYQTLIKGIQELKSGRDAGALSITRDSTKYLSQISFNSYAAMTKLNLEQVRAMIKATPEQILTHFNRSANVISTELNKTMGSLKTESKSILQGIGYLTTSIQLLTQQKKNFDTSIIQSFNSTIKNQCQQVINLVTMAMSDMKENVEDIKKNNLALSVSIKQHMGSMNAYIQAARVQTQSHVTLCFNNLESSISRQFASIRTYQYQLAHQQQQIKNQNEINRMFLQQTKALTQYQIQANQKFHQANFQQHQNRSQQNVIIAQKVDVILQKLQSATDQKNLQMQEYKKKFLAASLEKETYLKNLQQAKAQIQIIKRSNNQLNMMLQLKKQQDKQIAELIKFASSIATSKKIPTIKSVKTFQQLKNFVYSIGNNMKNIEISQEAQRNKEIYESAIQRRNKDLQQITKLKEDILEIKNELQTNKAEKKTLQKQISRLKQYASQYNDLNATEQRFSEMNSDILQDLRNLSTFVAFGVAQNRMQLKQYRNSEMTRLHTLFQQQIASIKQRQKLQVQALTRRLNESSAQIQQLKRKYRSINVDVSQKERQIKQLESDKKDVQQRIHALQRKIKDSQHNRYLEMTDKATVERLSSQLQKSRQQLKAKISQAASFSQEANTLLGQLAASKNELRRVSASLQSKNFEFTMMQQQHAKQISLKEAQIRDLEQTANQKTRQSQRNKSKYKDVQKQQSMILDYMGGEQFTEVGDLVKKQAKKISSLQKQISDQRSEHENLVKKELQQRSVLGNAQSKIDSLQNKLNSVNLSYHDINLLKSKLELNAKVNEETIRQNDKKIRDLEDKLESLEKQRKKKQQEYRQTNMTNQKLKIELRGLTKKINTLEIEKVQNDGQNQSLKETNQKFNKVIISLETAIAQKSGNAKMLEQTIQTLKYSLQGLQKEIDKKKLLISEVEKKLSNQQSQSKKKDSALDQIKNMVTSLNLKTIASKIIKKKIFDYQIKKQSEYNENLKKSIARLVSTIRQIDDDFVDLNDLFKQIMTFYGIHQQVLIDFSNKEVNDKLIQFIKLQKKQSDNRQYSLQKESKSLTDQLESTKSKLQDYQRLYQVLQMKHEQQIQNAEQKFQQQSQKIYAATAVNNKLEKQLQQKDIKTVELQGQLSKKQYNFQQKLLQYNQFTKQKQQLAVALSLRKQGTVVDILQKIVQDHFEIPQRAKGISDEIWINTLVQIMQKKRKRQSINKYDDNSDGQEKDQQTKLRMIQQNNNVEIQIENPSLTIQIPIGGSSGGGGEEPPRKSQIDTQMVDQTSIKYKTLESQYELAKLDYQKLKKEFEKLDNFFIEFESICIFLLQKFIKFMFMCSRYLQDFKQRHFNDAQKQRVTLAFLKFIGSLVQWVHDIFKNINFEKFIDDYGHIKNDLRVLHNNTSKGIYLIQTSTIQGKQLRNLLNQINTYVKNFVHPLEQYTGSKS